ncbi:hypothetical protein L6164_022545 [Bauhinia variegata]|uniref:Uncharacterized protein n=1 Tax=Bauhinia variegata TaxID=167791 RepID=A0ACB9MHC1_BAUVA|nr:hypothetical protein L6164_022545 [Bauhinia variegata]
MNSAIIASLNENLVTRVSEAALAEAKSSSAWSTLATLYANKSRSRVLSLKDKLAHLTKGSNFVSDYLHEIQTEADELALIGHPLDDLDLVIYALGGLGPDFKEITAALQVRDVPLSFKDLHEKLTDFERYLKKSETSPSDIPIATANVAKRYH